MSHSFTFKVDVELERDSGKFASRDEMSEAVEEALADVESNVNLSGLGPDSESEYSITSFEIEELEKKQVKALNAAYDKALPPARPTKSLETEIKSLKADIKRRDDKIEKLERSLDAKDERDRKIATRIYQDHHAEGEPNSYFADGPYDRVIFQVGESEYDRFAVSLKDGKISIRYENMGFVDMAIFTRSGNEVEIGVVKR